MAFSKDVIMKYFTEENPGKDIDHKFFTPVKGKLFINGKDNIYLFPSRRALNIDSFILNLKKYIKDEDNSLPSENISVFVYFPEKLTDKKYIKVADDKLNTQIAELSAQEFSDLVGCKNNDDIVVGVFKEADK